MEAVAPISRGVQIGVDIGQRVDPSAIIVAEVEFRDYVLQDDGTKSGGEEHYAIRHVSRLPLATPYPAVVERLTEVVTSLRTAGHRLNCFVDATGVGQPVVDLLRKAGINATAVYLTGGERETVDFGEIHLSKTVLVSRLQVLLQTRRIHLPQTAEAHALSEELLNYEIRVTEASNLKMGVFSIGKHDDLATALGLACRPWRVWRAGIW